MKNLKHIVTIEIDGNNIIVGDFLENENFEMGIKDIEILEDNEDINNIEDFEDLEEEEQKEIIIKELTKHYNNLIEQFYQKYIDMNIVNIEDVENFVSPKICKVDNTHILCEEWQCTNDILCTYISYLVQNDILGEILDQEDFDNLDMHEKDDYTYFDISEYIDQEEYQHIYYMDLTYTTIEEL